MYTWLSPGYDGAKNFNVVQDSQVSIAQKYIALLFRSAL